MEELNRREFIGLSTAGLALASSGKSEGLDEKSEDKNQILNIYDNIVYESGDAISNWGFSAYITYNGKTILFDAGTFPGILEHNAGVFGTDLASVETAVLSHRHSDHIGGFDYLLKINPDFKLLLPNDSSLGGKSELNAAMDKKLTWGYLFRHSNTELVKEHTEIAKGVYLIATSSPLIGGFSKYPPYEDEPRFWGLPELSLALENDDGQVTLISGCSHSKIEEIVKETKQHLKKEVNLVVGGFHHIPYSSDYVSSIAKMMKNELGVKHVASSHCTGEEAIKIFQDIYQENYYTSGLGSRLPL